MASQVFTSLCEQGAATYQEDAIFAESDSKLFIVCDGLGSKGSGAVASQIAISKIRDTVQSGANDLLALPIAEKDVRQKYINLLDEAFQSASKAIFDKAKRDPTFVGSCSTVDVFLQVEDRAFIGHVGSGRIYLIRNGELHQLTEDHTQLAHYRRVGRLEGLPVAQHAQLGKLLTRAVGFQEQIKVDILELELQEGDRILLCTDGLWQVIEEDRLQSAFVAHDLEIVLKQIQAGVSNNKDNMSVVLVAPSLQRQSLAENTADQKIKLTGKISLFRYLSYQELIKVVSVAELFKAKAGTMLCKEGEYSGEMMIILSGSVEVTKAGMLLSQMKKGEVFGEMSMIDTAPRSATVVAKEASSFLAFPRDALFALLRADSALSVKLLWGISQEMNKRIRKLTNKLAGTEDEVNVDRQGGKLPFYYSKEAEK